LSEKSVNRTCILKLQSEKNILKFSKALYLKKIDTFVQKNRAMAKNLVIVESCKKTIENWVVIFKWSQVTGILPTCLQR
jgi:hypothetical protein